MLEQFALGDCVQLKKPHACGTNSWTIIRDGADIKLRCAGCSHVVMLDRLKFIRSGKRILAHAEELQNGQ